MSLSKEILTQIASSLDAKNLLPKNMDVAQVGPLHMVNLYNEIDSLVIANSATTGIDKDLYTAIAKSLSEYFERKAFNEGYLIKNPYCQTERSDGFAAFPKVIPEHQTRTRENALNEALERYVWATWWDDLNITYDLIEKDLNDKDFWQDSIYFLKEVNDLFKIEKLKVITPHFDDFNDKEVIIIFCEIKDGVLSGGACGDKKDRSQTILRAIGELARHALALYKINVENHTPKSFYEKRLALFGSRAGFSIYQERLSKKGSESVKLPLLDIDHEIYNSNSATFYVHRCLFKNQPAFVGGNLERLCL